MADLSLILAPIFFNLDRYRPEVISYFEQNTGKKVEIERLALTFFPHVTIHMEGFGVKSPPLFPPSYIVKIARADVVVDFWPLLRRRVERAGPRIGDDSVLQAVLCIASGECRVMQPRDLAGGERRAGRGKRLVADQGTGLCQQTVDGSA